MADQGQTENKAPQSEASQNDLADELRVLGDNIKDFLHFLWESQERKRVQKDLEAGLSNLGASLNQAAAEFQQSPTGQRVKEEFEEISERVRSGEMESTIRRDFLSALKTANIELQKAIDKMASSQKSETGSETKPKT